MLPFLAQGANMALEDAWVLGVSLKNDKIETYQRLRAPRVAKVVKTTQGNAQRDHLRRGPVRLVVHTGLKILSTFAPKLMLKPFDWLYRHDVTQQK